MDKRIQDLEASVAELQARNKDLEALVYELITTVEDLKTPASTSTQKEEAVSREKHDESDNEGFITLSELCYVIKKEKPTLGKNTILEICREYLGILHAEPGRRNLPNLGYKGWLPTMYKVKNPNKLLLTTEGADFMINQILQYVDRNKTKEVVSSKSNVINIFSKVKGV